MTNFASNNINDIVTSASVYVVLFYLRPINVMPSDKTLWTYTFGNNDELKCNLM